MLRASQWGHSAFETQTRIAAIGVGRITDAPGKHGREDVVREWNGGPSGGPSNC